MKSPLTWKIGTIGLLALLLLIPLSMIDGLVQERQQLRNEVLDDIARSSSQPQQLLGPILVVPWQRTLQVWRTVKETGVRYQEEKIERGSLYFAPERFELDGQIATELRKRGIYEARLYSGQHQIKGHFQLPQRLGLGGDASEYRLGRPFLLVGISDVRGIRNAPQLQLNEQSIAFQPGSNGQLVSSGIHAPLPMLQAGAAQRLDFAFELQLQGTSQLTIVPVGRDSQVQLSSSWQHPSFTGLFLPVEREVSAEGFNARWQTSFFATSFDQTLRGCQSKPNGCDGLRASQFGVSFIEPVDHYLQGERAIKYALLFIGLTFAGFFLFEVLKKLAIHPMQYGLVGLALALFYLLLISLAEHMAFALAYLLAASACVSLLGVYLACVLASRRRAAGFAGALAGLYALLYGLLSAEDYALLMGSLLVFALLAGFMLLTRNLDWYAVSRPALRQPASGVAMAEEVQP